MGNIPYLLGGLLGTAIGIGFWVFVGWLAWKALKWLYCVWRKKAGPGWRTQVKYLGAVMVISVLAILGALAYRHEKTPTITSPQVAASQPPPTYQRFLPYPQATGLALDTKTGLLCHTFNEAIDAVSEGGAKSLLPGQHFFDSVPLCVDLSQSEDETIKAQLNENENARNISQRQVIEDSNGKKWYIVDK
jgi:hypothetical protein